MSIADLNTLELDLVAKDFSDGHTPSNGGPTKTSPALAIIHLAARDAYARVTSAYPPRLTGLPVPPPSVTTDNRGVIRPIWEQTFTLHAAIEQNRDSRVYLGVQWKFDATKGEALDRQIAAKTVGAFM